MLLALVTEVGSLLRAALGPKTRKIPGQSGAITMMRQLHCLIIIFFYFSVKESRWRVCISSETDQFMFRAFMSQAFWSGTGDTYSGTLWFRQVVNRST